MTIVLAKHDNDPKEYVFAVPANMRIIKGDLLLVNTMRGKDIATATTDLIEGSGAEDVAIRFGAYRPIKTVEAVCGEALQNYIRKRTLKDIIKVIKEQSLEDYLPF